MSDQFMLPGLEPPPKITDRLFFAVMPDEQAIARITQLTRQLSRDHGLQGRPIDVSRLHITLLFLGDHPGLSKTLLTAANQAAAAIQQPVFATRFNRVVSFAGSKDHRPLVLLGEEDHALPQLHKTLLTSVQKQGITLPRTSAFKPHLTLLYDGVGVPETEIEPIEWQVREFVLLHSHIGRGGTYEVLGRWSLQGQCQA
ncbi:MAG: RNA 2',3'-cyclic phosphodiesterase [Steroidobacteraceae bacterium]